MLVSRPIILLLLSAGLAGTIAQPARADIDCKVILCLAGGFPSGCEDAFSYMIDRISPPRPKPPFGFCPMQSADGTQSEYTGATARQVSEEERECTTYRRSRDSDGPGRCIREKVTRRTGFHIAIDADAGEPDFTNTYFYRTTVTIEDVSNDGK